MTEPIEAAALKPCPFCGATPHRGLGKVYYDQLHGEPQQNYSIWCPRGHAKITRVDCEQATEEWNTRASPAASGDLRERIARSAQGFWQSPSGRSWEECCEKLPPQADWFRSLADAILASLPGRDDEAIRADERERCAKIAENYQPGRRGLSAWKAIAAAIRSLQTERQS